MSVTKEAVPVRGILRGQGRERRCQLRAVRHAVYADEGSHPASLSYSRCEIEDGDDFPDGNYEVEFDGRTVLLVRQAGRYSPICQT